ncbi:acetylornithine aminotransferase [Fibrobacterales bacterium]|nr:acetylornithine aminotransferase [Fibrobacterales bacterium]
MNFLEQDSSVIAPLYAKSALDFVKGEGVYLYDAKGKAYLDFASGISVNALGHRHPALLNALKEQSEKFFHISNLFPNEPQIKLAEKMLSLMKFGETDGATTNNYFSGKAFFCNSGTEANEAAIKFARKYFAQKGENRTEIISFLNGFHGRTYGALSATGQPKLQAGFGKMLSDFSHIEWNNADALKKSVGEKTAAIILEPIVAEGGILTPSKEFINAINELAAKFGFLVIADEIQAGMGRCGAFSAAELYGINADITTWAKAIGGGLPLGAVLMKNKIAEILKPGDHGTTFGGNPLACTLGLAVAEEISKPDFLKSVQARSEQLKNGLAELAKKYSWIGEVRGEGLLLGVPVEKPVADLINACREKGLLVLRAGADVLRLLPPLIISEEDVSNALEKLDEACGVLQ